MVKTLLGDLGVDIKRLANAYDQDFYRLHGLSGGIFFNRYDWGADRLVRYDIGTLDYLPLAPSTLTAAQAAAQMPLNDAARTEFVRLMTTGQDRMPEIAAAAKQDYLYSISYREFLGRHLDIREPAVFAMLQDLTSDSSVGIEATSAGDAIFYSGLPGARATGLPGRADEEPYIYHFPDGNASVARLLVREMIPSVAPGSSMEDVVSARFDYSQLDLPKAALRLRLNSTVIHVENDAEPGSAKQVSVSYVQAGTAHRVTARNCVLACYNAMIPYLCPSLPAPQREALAEQVKTPILYTNVALRNWQAWKKLGIGAVVSSGSYHLNAMLDFPVSLGDYTYGAQPDEPIAVHMERFPHRANQGLSAREQRRRGRYELLATSFESMERKIREQLAATLSGGGFDPARDIEGITVNRWAHGYADGYNPLEDPYYKDKDDARYPHVRGRKPFGRITIANSDSGASAMLESAVEQAFRAVNELG